MSAWPVASVAIRSLNTTSLPIPSARTVVPGGVPLALGLTAPVTPTVWAMPRPANPKSTEAIVEAAIAMRRGLMMSPLESDLRGKGRRGVVEREIGQVRGRDLPLDPDPGGEPFGDVQELRCAEEPTPVAALHQRIDRGIGAIVGRPIVPHFRARLPGARNAGKAGIEQAPVPPPIAPLSPLLPLGFRRQTH